MDSKKLLEVIALYRQTLNSLGVKPARYPIEQSLPKFFYRRPALAHCSQMLEQMETFVAEGQSEKAFRWLGFIQGVFWILGVSNIAELKKHNKPAE